MSTKVDVVVLGLLAERPMHGYDVLERYRARGMGLWSDLSRASLYQALKRLEREGLVVGKSQEGREGPDRRVFRITRLGRDRLAEGAAELAEDAVGSDAAAALGFGHVLSASAARATAEVRERAVQAMLGSVRDEIERSGGARDPGRAVSIAMLRRQEALAEAELAWMRSYRSALGKVRR
jgi:DNA-binding PadR family transcriptional regulator